MNLMLHPGISRFGISASLNKLLAIGYDIKATTNKETPPYVSSAPDKTIDNIALSLPNFFVIKWEIDFA